MVWTPKLLRRTVATLTFIGVFYVSIMPLARTLLDRSFFGMRWLWDGDGGWVYLIIFSLCTAFGSIGAALASITIKRLQHRHEP